jgi:hypothetical protein
MLILSKHPLSVIIPQHSFLMHYFNSTTLPLICDYTTFLLYPFIPPRPHHLSIQTYPNNFIPSILKTPPRSKSPCTN